jgi:hypothetical protein
MQLHLVAARDLYIARKPRRGTLAPQPAEEAVEAGLTQ